MTNKNKIKGTAWENEVVKLLNAPFSEPYWKRIALSGALGSMLGEPLLSSDVLGRYPFIPFPIQGEAKVGYGGVNMTIRKEWFDKIKQTADASYGFPLVLLKFTKARSGVKAVVAMDLEDWNRLMLHIEKLHGIKNSPESDS